VILTDDDVQLLARAADWQSEVGTPAAFWLPDLVRREGLDFATAVLYDRVKKQPANARFLELATGSVPIRDLLIGVVPGAFHTEHRKTGADGARVFTIAHELRCEAELIPTAGFGGLEENARIILKWLQGHRGQRIALISLSKGGAEVQRAMTLDATCFDNVVAWVSFSGMLQGTPLIDWLQRRPLRWWSIRLWLWWRRHGSQALQDLRYTESASAGKTLPALAHLRMVHVYGFPLRRHLAHPWAARGYDRIAPLGPNDGGGILLGDCLTWPGIVCPIWGVDHYLAPPWDLRPQLTGIVAASLRE
jgi:hypothetical protein